MQHSEFVMSEDKRKRYWARSLVGYRYFDSRKPNSAHYDLAALQQAGFVGGIITQNVDTLHTQAGSTVPELRCHAATGALSVRDRGAQR
jgi:NAD-dependent SIR2 family protein deacetylase